MATTIFRYALSSIDRMLAPTEEPGGEQAEPASTPEQTDRRSGALAVGAVAGVLILGFVAGSLLLVELAYMVFGYFS